MIPPLLKLYEDLDHSKLRFKYPSKFIFLCGGIISPDGKAVSLRDYLYRVRNIESRLAGGVILAEKATQLYRDSQYKDLISFEEDVARIAAIVLVIPESPGSLAELGSFSTNDTIREALRVIIQDRHERAESFIRWGPIQRIYTLQGRDFVGVYPWRNNNANHPIIRSIKPHYRSIVDFINEHLHKLHASISFMSAEERRIFYVTYWVIYLLVAVSPVTLESCVRFLLPDAVPSEIHRKLYCMILAGWVKKYSYSSRDYYYVTRDEDPFAYSYTAEATEKDTLRRKIDIAHAARDIERVPSAVIRIAADGRKTPP